MKRSKRRTPKTLIAAFAVSGVVIWQVSVGFSGGALLGRGRAYEKTVDIPADEMGSKFQGRIRQETDPVAAYIEKAKRGMTEQEIRWIISDFKAIGTMPTSLNPDDLRDFREKQNEWYLTALSEALSLTSEQKQAVRASLKESLDRGTELFVANKGSSTVPSAGIFYEMNFEATMWMRDDKFAPWNLCKLSGAQSGLTMEREWRDRMETAPRLEGGFRWVTQWLAHSAIAMKDPASGEVIVYPPPTEMPLPCTMPGTIHGGILDISTAFPLTPDQELADHRLDFAAQAKLLQPAQLRMALLLSPSLAVTILTAMDKPAPSE